MMTVAVTSDGKTLTIRFTRVQKISKICRVTNLEQILSLKEQITKSYFIKILSQARDRDTDNDYYQIPIYFIAF
jgi:hypothetical protein